MNKTTLPIAVDPPTYRKFNACIHCGLCLPACPTYVVTGNEADSPRGRIHLMKAAVDGGVVASAVVLRHLEQCLVCRACETACPSGVVYHDLIESVRPQVAQAVQGAPTANALLGWLVKHVLPFPPRLRGLVVPWRLARKLGLGAGAAALARILPDPIPALVALAPSGPPDAESLPDCTPAMGEKRGKVVLLRGCVGAVLSDSVNRAAVRVLSINGFDVHLLPDESCCGAMAQHANDPDSAVRFARATIDTLAARSENFFVSPIAGCGAQLKALDRVLAGRGAYAARARAVVAKVRDICELLDQAGLRLPPRRLAHTVTYHDPCHLAQAQRLADPPRRLLGQIPGLTLVPLREADMCCGAAGTYALTQPALAGALGRRKAGHLAATGAGVCATANLGCQMQIEQALAAAGTPMPVRHVVELLAESYDDR